MSMTRTPDMKRVNGVHPMSRDRQNHVIFSRKRRWCWRFSWITEVLCMMNSFQKARPSTSTLGVTRRLREVIRQKRPDLWANNSWILHHDNAPSHNAIVIREHLAKNETNSYSVDSRNRSAECVTAPEMRSWKNWRWLWWLYRKPIIKNVSRIGSSAGISALQSMGSTSKGTISIMMNRLVFFILKIKS